MTETPPIARPARPDARSGPRPEPKAPLKPRARAEARRPLHLAVAIGLSAGAYAVALAGVTALQSSSDQALVADRAPTSDVVDQLRLEHARLEARITRASAAYDEAVTAYGRAASGLDSYEQKLGILARQVAIAHASAVSTTSSGSGLRASSGRAAPTGINPSSGNAPAPARLPAIARAAQPAPPPVQATTCASGKPCP